ncbi:fascin domain-containing protein [Aquimarina algicola]|uniref:Uncharacterized protein n=1 Tax=Aquimarina algicola TaxID=2589995 RepID=A0A504JJ48_9FLAO|nr:hypothetical protein [Aquimarina algicola]TPN86779.1 hypothetical protein FHK87_04030 [Aquimarina algicola]
MKTLFEIHQLFFVLALSLCFLSCEKETIEDDSQESERSLSEQKSESKSLGIITIKCNNGKYVSDNNGNAITCNSSTVGNNERFELINVGPSEGFVAIKGNNGKYLSLGTGGKSFLRFNKNKIDIYERFYIPFEATDVYIRSPASGNIVSSENGEGPMTCNKNLYLDGLGASEIFEITFVKD